MVMAQIYTMVGEYDKAIDELAYLMSIPSQCSSAFLRADPIFAPLQELPRFIALLEKYETK
jgi:hypothetical protein